MKVADKLPYVIARPLADGTFSFHFQPSTRMRARGIRPVELGKGPSADNPPEDVRALARTIYQQVEAMKPGARPRSPRLGSSRHGPTFAAMIEDYKATKRFERLAPATQKLYTICLGRLLEWGGDLRRDLIEPLAVQDLHDEIAATAPAMAGQIIDAGHRVFNFHNKGRRGAFNPFADIDVEPPTARNQVLPEPLITHLVACADAMNLTWFGTFVLVDVCLGQRPGDILKLTRRQWRPDPDTGLKRFWIKPQKTSRTTGKVIAVRAISALAARLEAHPPAGMTIIGDAKGRPINYAKLLRAWTEVRELAIRGSNEHGIRPWAQVWAEAIAADPSIALDHLPIDALTDGNFDPLSPEATPDVNQYQMRDLRRTAVVWLFRAGCNESEAAAISGHSLREVSRIFEVYGPRDTAMATSAIEKLEAWLKRKALTTNG